MQSSSIILLALETLAIVQIARCAPKNQIAKNGSPKKSNFFSRIPVLTCFGGFCPSDDQQQEVSIPLQQLNKRDEKKTLEQSGAMLKGQTADSQTKTLGASSSHEIHKQRNEPEFSQDPMSGYNEIEEVHGEDKIKRVRRKSEPAAAIIVDFVYDVQVAVHRNLQQKMVHLSEEEEDEIDSAVKRSVEQSIFRKASPAEIAEQVKQTVADILATKHDLPLEREVALWSSLQRDAEEAASNNPVSIKDSIEEVLEHTAQYTDTDAGISGQRRKPVARKGKQAATEMSALVDAIQNAVHLKLKQKQVSISEKEDEINDAIKNSIDRSISHHASVVLLAKQVKEAVADVIGEKHDMPLWREDAFWSALGEAAQEAAQNNLIWVENSSDDDPKFTAQNIDRGGEFRR